VVSICAALAVAAYVRYGANRDGAETSSTSTADVPDADPLDVPETLTGVGRSRIVYPYSVVPGGVHSAAELTAAVEADPIVAAHYTHLSVPALRQERVRERRAVYMSYRVGDQIYWTKRPVALRPGELVLSDGREEIRARCGNCISDVPMEPTLTAEPDPTEFDRGIVGPLAALGDLSLPADPTGAVFPFGDPSESLSAPLGALPAGLGSLSPSLAFPGGTGGAPRLAIPGGPLGDPFDPGPAFSLSPLMTLPGGDDPDQVLPGDDPYAGDPLDPPPGPPVPPWPPTEPAPVPVPEPGSILLVGTGLAACAIRRLRARRHRP
jgi:hypothetical protein